MDIVMLGHSGAGKTTYMSLMYKQLNAGVKGFHVTAQHDADHRRLMRNARKIRWRRYPSPSDQRGVYDLLLRHSDSDVISFRWRDHRGGAATERPLSSPEAEQLIDDLRSADGIVAFVDADELHRGTRSVLRQARALAVILVGALAERTAATPVVLALTKADLLPGDADLTGPLTEAFGGLLQAVAQSPHVYGTVVPVACGPKPEGVALPVLWCLHFGIRARVEAHAAAVLENAEHARLAESRDTVGDRFISWLTGNPSWRDVGVGHRQAAREENDKLQPLVRPAEDLATLLTDLPVF